MGWFGGSKKVLVVDDDTGTRSMMAMFFSDIGFEVLEAGDGMSGIEKAKSGSPSLILLDMMMPGMTGVDTLTHLKSNPATKDIPVVMVTARGMVMDVERCLAAGASDFVQKPFELAQLKAKVERALSQNPPK